MTKTFDVATIRRDFPIFERLVNGKPLVYLDSAATSQKPRVVIDAIEDYYERFNANIHRGIYTIAEEATAAYEASRRKVAQFIGAPETAEVIFTRNTTEAINLLIKSAWNGRLKSASLVGHPRHTTGGATTGRSRPP